ncbi:hypothetical protein ACFQHV_00270 [Promicromonospora thailandica]|uniref:DUF2993 family protein n=1 Tax=Promicromonospora thailandica TaxID=765201 RepID=A0A9X2G5D9_9MICO|nr:hypothetical protein [Promicromonospora thailandica]MCP2262826.1 hypothetical protein [Promicromonospora thailandica]BFF18160.1 hypothetical protein GCM10025730_16810 [Promicromonospora thailandica]
MSSNIAVAPSAPTRPRRRWIIVVATVVGVLVVLGVVAEVVLRGLIDDRIGTAARELPAGVTVARDDTPALWQVATGAVTLRVHVAPESLTGMAQSATELPGLEVAAEAGALVARVPLPVGGSTQTVDVLLDVSAEDGRAVVRADTVRFAGLSLPVSAVADQIGDPRLNQLTEGVTFPEGESQVAISSARATEDGLELGAEVALW